MSVKSLIGLAHGSKILINSLERGETKELKRIKALSRKMKILRKKRNFFQTSVSTTSLSVASKSRRNDNDALKFLFY
jgi:hypothetical protein